MTNNNLTGGWIIESLPGDVTGPNGWADSMVNMRDVGYVAKRFGADPSAPLWDSNADIDDNGKINMKDIGIAARNFEKVMRT